MDKLIRFVETLSEDETEALAKIALTQLEDVRALAVVKQWAEENETTLEVQGLWED